MTARVYLIMVGACLLGCSGPPAARRASPAVLAATFTEETWEYAGHTGKLVRTPSYRLFTTAQDTALAAQMPRFLEECLERYTTAIIPLPLPSMRLDTFLMGDREQWTSLTKQVMGDQAPTYLRIERGGFASGGRALLWTIGRRDTFAIAAHEGWHQYTQRTFGQELPAWMEEGIAVYMEGFVEDPTGRPIFLGWANVERFEQLRRAREHGQLMPLDQLLDASPQTLISGSTEMTLTYYAELWALVHYLREGSGERGRKALAGMVSDAHSGRIEGRVRTRVDPAGSGRPTGPQVFMAYFDTDLMAADRRFKIFIARLVAGGRPETISRGESPLD